MPKISVIMPAYNIQKYIRAAIESVLSQSFADFELIVVDDGSTDGTDAIVSEYGQKDHRIKLISQPNRGVALARNEALRHASGEWLAFCDADDTIPERAYEQLIAHSDGKDIVIGNFYDIDDNGATTESALQKHKYRNDAERILSVVCLWNKLIRRSLVEREGLLFEEVVLGEDAIFLSRLTALQPKFVMIDDYVYYHWIHYDAANPTLTRQYNLEKFMAHIYSRTRMEEIAGAEVSRMVHEQMTPFLVGFFKQLGDPAEREKAFAALADFSGGYDWEKRKFKFYLIFGVGYSRLKGMSAGEYYDALKSSPKLMRYFRQLALGKLSVGSVLKRAARRLSRKKTA